MASSSLAKVEVNSPRAAVESFPLGWGLITLTPGLVLVACEVCKVSAPASGQQPLPQAHKPRWGAAPSSLCASEPPNEPRGNNFTTALLVGVGKCSVKCPEIPRNEQKSLCFILLVAVSHTRGGVAALHPVCWGSLHPAPQRIHRGGPSWFWQLSKSRAVFIRLLL